MNIIKLIILLDGAPHRLLAGIVFKIAQYRVLIILAISSFKKKFTPAHASNMESKWVFNSGSQIDHTRSQFLTPAMKKCVVI